MIKLGFWKKLKEESTARGTTIAVLAPMANVTDQAFRELIATYGKPDVTWTEFVSADGLCSPLGRPMLLRDLAYSEGERPIVAQLFTSNPDKMREAAALVQELGFDGLDINMGCPDKTIEKQGAGAAMMKNPEQAVAVIRAARKGAPNLPISVKTRIGYNKNELEAWLPKLLAEDLAVVTIHARTRKEMSDVPARWEYVKRAVEIRDEIQGSDDEAKASGRARTLIFGNGDVTDLTDANVKARETGADDEGKIADCSQHKDIANARTIIIGGEKALDWVFLCIPVSSHTKLTKLGRINPGWPHSFNVRPQFDPPAGAGGVSATAAIAAKVAPPPVTQAPPRPQAPKPVFTPVVAPPGAVSPPRPQPPPQPQAPPPARPAPSAQPTTKGTAMKKIEGEHALLIKRTLDLIIEHFKAARGIELTEDLIRDSKNRVQIRARGVLGYIVCNVYFVPRSELLDACPTATTGALYQSARIVGIAVMEGKAEADIVKAVLKDLAKEFPVPEAPPTSSPESGDEETSPRRKKKATGSKGPKASPPPRASSTRGGTQSAPLLGGNGNGHLSPRDIVAYAVVLVNGGTDEAVQRLANSLRIDKELVWAAVGRVTMTLQQTDPTLLEEVQKLAQSGFKQ